ncbi:MAG TPA: DUF4242 domain-containing protein [Candidatus Limnocylindria bacterium]|nr:DUF4242 domain-containing protein [Candidatus Limnocylindria bacterium]
MPKFVIERDMPGAGGLPAAEFRGAVQRSCTVLRKMGPDIQWLESFVTQDKVYCVYIAASAHAIREHAEAAGLPATRISEVKRVIDPTLAE